MGSSVHKQTYHYYLTTPAWKRRRDAQLERCRFCQNCGSSLLLHVHHVSYASIFDESPSDLMTLCANCHAAEHGEDVGNVKLQDLRVRFSFYKDIKTDTSICQARVMDGTKVVYVIECGDVLDLLAGNDGHGQQDT